MSTFRPFKGLRPRPDLAEQIASPPYDVINSEEAREMAAGNPLTFLHVVKPEIDLDPSIDLYDDRVYAKAAENFNRLIDEGLAVVKGVRARHDGVRRNPWNEFECGSHYSRSMASWSVLTALSGFSFDLPKGQIGFDPRLKDEVLHSFWSTNDAWGRFSQCAEGVRLEVAYGAQTLSRLALPQWAGKLSEAAIGGKDVGLSWDGDTAVFAESVTIAAGQTLTLS